MAGGSQLERMPRKAKGDGLTTHKTPCPKYSVSGLRTTSRLLVSIPILHAPNLSQRLTVSESLSASSMFFHGCLDPRCWVQAVFFNPMDGRLTCLVFRFRNRENELGEGGKILQRLKPLLDNFIREDTQRTGEHKSVFIGPSVCLKTV